MRARLTSITVAALALASCFQVEPLPDCEDAGGDDGLYTRHHVCMPLAGPPLEMPVAPRRLLRGDFDDEGVDNDFAILLDLGFIQIYTTRDRKTAKAVELQMEGRIEAITAGRYFDGGTVGADLIGVTAGDTKTGTPGKVFGFHNGGDLFADAELEVFDAFTLFPVGTCPAPSSIEAIRKPGTDNATALAIGCNSGPPPMTAPTEEPLDGIVVFVEDKAFGSQARVGLQIPQLTAVHALNVAQLDGLGMQDVVVAHVPQSSSDHVLAIFLIFPDDKDGLGTGTDPLEVPLTHGEIERILVGDLDDDADIDLVAVHPEGRGISTVRQRRGEPLSFEAPEFVDVGAVIRDAILGDFTGDGQTDIAVAHEVDDSGLNGISILVRSPDMAPGQIGYTLAPAGSIRGEAVDLEPLDYDGDGRTDIAAVLKVGSEGRVYFWLNRSPAG